MVQKPLSEVERSVTSQKGFVFFFAIFAGRDREGNEQKFGEEGDHAKQWSLCFEKSVSTRQVLVV